MCNGSGFSVTRNPRRDTMIVYDGAGTREVSLNEGQALIDAIAAHRRMTEVERQEAYRDYKPLSVVNLTEERLRAQAQSTPEGAGGNPERA